MITLNSNLRQLLLLLALAALFLLLIAIPVHGAAASLDPYSPERSVAMDIPWMSPPTVVPQTGSASSRVMDQGVAMQDSNPDLGANFTWKLRYPIELQRWPILVLRYRASSLEQGATYADRVVQLDLRSGATVFQTVTAIRLSELVLDGALHEVRRDLRGVAGGSMVEAIRFTFQGMAGGTGRLDVLQMQFEQAPNTATGEALTQTTVPFIVKDAAGKPVAGAEVRVGILERSNWTTIGQTGRDGQVTLAATLGPGIGGNGTAPVEAAVMRNGYLTEYVAPIQPPVGNGGIQVTLKAVTQPVEPPAAVNPTPIEQPTATGYDNGDGWATPNVAYPPVYDSGYGGDYYGSGYNGGAYYGGGYYGGGYYGGYYGGYGSGWWIPWHCWPGWGWGGFGGIVVVSNGDGDCDRDDGHHGNNGNHHGNGQGWSGRPGHWTAPGAGGVSGSSPWHPGRQRQAAQPVVASHLQATTPRLTAPPVARGGGIDPPAARWTTGSGISRGSASGGVMRASPAGSGGQGSPPSAWSSGGGRSGVSGGGGISGGGGRSGVSGGGGGGFMGGGRGGGGGGGGHGR